MAIWLNRTPVTSAENGTASHSLTFAAASAGSLLVAVMDASAVITMPSGWTRRAQALNQTDCSIFTKTATSGESSVTLTLSAPDYSLAAAIYEFAAGSAWVNGVSSTGQSMPAPNPTLSGLTGVNFLLGVVGVGATGDPSGTTVAWNAPTVADVLQVLPHGANDGTFLAIGVVEQSALTTYAPTPTRGGTYDGGFTFSEERLTAALKVTAPPDGGGTDYTATLTDAVAVSDSATHDGATNYTVAVTDLLGVTDTGQPYSLDRTIPVPDSLTIGDAAGTARDHAAALADSVTVTDRAATARDHAATVTDGIDVTDAATHDGATDYTATITDALTISDDITRALDRVATVADFLTLTETATSDLLAPVDHAATINDAVAVTDTATGRTATPGAERNLTVIAGPITRGWDAATPTHAWTGDKPTGNQWNGQPPTHGWTPGPITQ